MTDRDRKKLQGCDHRLVEALERVFETMDRHGWTLMITSGVRTAAEQWTLWLKGRPWLPGGTRERLVTHADGKIKKSNHQSGRAADCAFVIDGQPSWDEDLPWELYGETSEQEGLEWGGRWPDKKTDKPHVQLPELPEGTQLA